MASAKVVWPAEVNRRRRGHRFYPTVAARVPALYSTDGDGALDDKVIRAHYFVGGCDWLVVEADPATGDAFGWAQIVPGGGEWGSFNLTELETLRVGPYGQPVERDMHWAPTRFADTRWAA